MTDESPSGIVVGCDGSPAADLALGWAVAEAERTGERLTILHCVEVAASSHLTAANVLGWAPEGPEHVEPGERRALDAALDTLGARATYRTVVGSAAAQLVVASRAASLVVVGSRGRGALSTALLGSTSYAVAAHAHCPVAVIRSRAGATEAARPGPHRPVVVGVETAGTSGAALTLAARTAADTGAALRIIRAFELPVVPGALEMSGTGDADAAPEQAAADAGEAAADAGEAAQHVRLLHPRLDVGVEVVEGRPGHVLSRSSESAGLLVVGSRGRGGFTGLLLGSVCHTVIHEARCPVLVVR